MAQSTTQGVFHLSELAGQSGQFVNRMYHLKNTFYASPSHFFKITRTVFEVTTFQDFATPLLQNDAFDLQTGRSDMPVLANEKQ